ncbi:hypothetical protein PFISCL1PPCAC_26897, partial [Pristionchus fissidentatus]
PPPPPPPPPPPRTYRGRVPVPPRPPPPPPVPEALLRQFAAKYAPKVLPPIYTGKNGVANLPLLLDQNGRPVPMMVDGVHEASKARSFPAVAPDAAGFVPIGGPSAQTRPSASPPGFGDSGDSGLSRTKPSGPVPDSRLFGGAPTGYDGGSGLSHTKPSGPNPFGGGEDSGLTGGGQSGLSGGGDSGGGDSGLTRTHPNEPPPESRLFGAAPPGFDASGSGTRLMSEEKKEFKKKMKKFNGVDTGYESGRDGVTNSFDGDSGMMMGGAPPPPDFDMNSFGKSGTGFGLSQGPEPTKEEPKPEPPVEEEEKPKKKKKGGKKKKTKKSKGKKKEQPQANSATFGDHIEFTPPPSQNGGGFGGGGGSFGGGGGGGGFGGGRGPSVDFSDVEKNTEQAS